MSATEAELFQDLPIINRRGLHARASAKFVQCADAFNAEITVSKDQNTVGGTSIMGLMMLAAGIGSSIRVTATGPEAEAALAAIAKLVGDRFGEEE
ncbi:HPr family phosphocarrier protein [Kaistia dalseonensis]|uniref:Phosphocarrier protein n=1 Tax=Kaistia dalseonensis TaxID=410840 RepID=A0ABU0H5D2_9HYPH|nr:HPr family phosphocarrier protein [Kaistia dalseonensis]MCX5494926.1 HPr family phosphocarrier protein [Kaistia dalseonensis]MDQ0437507.1 phosphocarrier protein [Kaistia dalseonensis]